MPSPIHTIRILPMSDKIPGFRRLTIPQLQSQFFLQKLPASQGRFRYPSSGLRADPGTLVLFQFQARIVASALLLRAEKILHPPSTTPTHAGILHFDPASIRTFTPLDFPTLLHIWPALRPLGHVKQSLNPARYPLFKRQLKNLARLHAKYDRRTQYACGK